MTDIDTLWWRKHAAQERVDQAHKEAAALRRQLNQAQHRVRKLERERDAARKAWSDAKSRAKGTRFNPALEIQ